MLACAEFPSTQGYIMRFPHNLTHVVKGEVDVSSIFRFDHVLKSDYVVVPCKRLQVHDLSESALSVRGVPESIKALLQCQDLATSFLDSLPDNAVCLRRDRGS